MNQEIIGKFIAECRKEKNMTQQELADKLGVTDRAISHWENGRRLPDYSLLKELCDTLSISINEFALCEIYLMNSSCLLLRHPCLIIIAQIGVSTSCAASVNSCTRLISFSQSKHVTMKINLKALF